MSEISKNSTISKSAYVTCFVIPVSGRVIHIPLYFNYFLPTNKEYTNEWLRNSDRFKNGNLFFVFKEMTYFFA